MRLGRHSGIVRRGRWTLLGIGRFGLIVGWGTWGDFKRVFSEVNE